MGYHPITNDIQNLLKQNSCWYESFEHDPVRTSEEASKTRPGYTLHQGAKAIIVRAKKSKKDKFYVMLVFPADMKFDNSKVKTLLEVKDIRFASSDEIAMLTAGVETGGVPPFGNLFDLRVIADAGLFANERIVFNAGDRRFSIAMLSKDYQNLVNPSVADIVSDKD